MGIMVWSYGYDGLIIWVWCWDHMGMVLGSYGYDAGIIWVWWFDHMGMMVWSYDGDGLIIWWWCWDHMCMMFVPYVYGVCIICVWCLNHMCMIHHRGNKKDIIITYMLHIVGIICFYRFFFFAITGNGSMCIGINFTMIISSTHLNTTRTITWHFTMT